MENRKSHILLVEDDRSIIRNLSVLLEQEGFLITAAGGQREALSAMESGSFDLLLLDLSLPDGSGYAVCSAAKKAHRNLPVLFLSASDDEMSVVTGFDLGADDYIIKPFRPMELVSRIRNALRRSGRTQSVFEYGGIRLDSVRGTVRKNGEELFLSALEYRLLLVFLTNRGIVLTRDRLLELIWDMAGEFVGDNTLSVCIKRLREKIEDDPRSPALIRTVRGLGYKLGD